MKVASRRDGNASRDARLSLHVSQGHQILPILAGWADFCEARHRWGCCLYKSLWTRSDKEKCLQPASQRVKLSDRSRSFCLFGFVCQLEASVCRATEIQSVHLPVGPHCLRSFIHLISPSPPPTLVFLQISSISPVARPTQEEWSSMQASGNSILEVFYRRQQGTSHTIFSRSQECVLLSWLTEEVDTRGSQDESHLGEEKSNNLRIVRLIALFRRKISTEHEHE